VTRPRLLDLYCGAGGASAGYAAAGFEVTGVDLHPQPRYPFAFVQADALELDAGFLGRFDAVHASPPCQHYSQGAGKWGTRDEHPHLIPATRELLEAGGRPWVLENIPTARAHLRRPVMLCGTQFGLGVFRHRLFEAPFPLDTPEHARHQGRIGDGRYHTVAGHAGGSSRRDGWTNGGVGAWRTAMGIDWMTGAELAESIPPAYTRWIGSRILQVLSGMIVQQTELPL
jgi:DNA (cytosine-5)-methyltransferase 1